MRGINFTHTWGSESKHSVLEQPDKVQSWGRAVDVQTVHMYRNLRKAIVKWTIDSKEPIPEMKYIKPSLVAVCGIATNITLIVFLFLLGLLGLLKMKQSGNVLFFPCKQYFENILSGERECELDQKNDTIIEYSRAARQHYFSRTDPTNTLRIFLDKTHELFSGYRFSPQVDGPVPET